MTWEKNCNKYDVGKDNDVDNDEDYKMAVGRGVTADLSVGLP